MMSFMNPYIKRLNDKFITASGMSEYTLYIQNYMQMIFGSEDLKLPIPTSNTAAILLLKQWSSDQQLQHQHHLKLV